MFEDVVKKLPFMILYVPGWYKTKEICDKVILANSGMFGFNCDCCISQKVGTLRSLNYVPECHKTHAMCEKTVYAFLVTLNFVLESFVKYKILGKPDDALFSNTLMLIETLCYRIWYRYIL